MYNKILVPLDGSELAESVLPYVEAMAATESDISITFLYVVTVDIPMAGQKFKDKIEEDATTAAGDYLTKLCNRLKYKSEVKTVVMTGKAAETIADYAKKQKMNLIIMATHGRSGIGRFSHGSVADKVLHDSEIPIWMVRAGLPSKKVFKKGQKIKMMVPLDGSKLAEGVLSHVADLAKQLGDGNYDITLFRTIELFSPPFIYPPEMPINIEEYLEYEKKRTTDICTQYLEKMQAALEKKGVKSKYAIKDGIPADIITDYASKNDIDVIIMSTHGRTGLSRWAFGSIAEKVVQSAGSSVFLVRSTEKK
jgi:nucleotide-binding universal stress UspA family protein